MFQWPILAIVKAYRFSLLPEKEYLAFDGLHFIFSIVAGLIIPLIWVLKDNYIRKWG